MFRDARRRESPIFGFRERHQKPSIDRKQSLDAVPVLNPDVSVDRSNPEGDVITVRVRRGAGWLSVFQPQVMERRVKLDELGTFVFRLIDGKRTTREIMDSFAAHYRVNRREAELSCVAFLKTLTSRLVISIAVR